MSIKLYDAVLNGKHVRVSVPPREIVYYAVALNAQGKLAQLLVTRVMGDEPGECISKSQEFTGVVYKTKRAAIADVARLNGCR